MYLWKRIIEQKIKNQANVLKIINKNSRYEQLLDYAASVLMGDETNREGHSAKVYFNCLFGKSFNRKENNEINKYLNYGYSILLSVINREIKILGYLTELGIHHIGESNSFNLSCDFIEPLRSLVDLLVITNQVNEQNFKQVFIELLTRKVLYNDKELFLDNAIHLMVEDWISYMVTGEEEKIKFINYEN